MLAAFALTYRVVAIALRIAFIAIAFLIVAKFVLLFGEFWNLFRSNYLFSVSGFVSSISVFYDQNFQEVFLYLVLFMVFGAWRGVSELRTHVRHTKIAVVAISNWIGWSELDSPGQRVIREKGWSGVIEAWKTNFFLWLFTGESVDDTLLNVPLRDGMRISFDDDLRQGIRDAIKPGAES